MIGPSEFLGRTFECIAQVRHIGVPLCKRDGNVSVVSAVSAGTQLIRVTLSEWREVGGMVFWRKFYEYSPLHLSIQKCAFHVQQHYHLLLSQRFAGEK